MTHNNNNSGKIKTLVLGHLVVQSVQVIQAIGDAGQVVIIWVLLIGWSGQVAVGWVDIWRH